MTMMMMMMMNSLCINIYIYFALYTEIPEVNLFAFAYRLFHEDFSPLNGALLLNLFLKECFIYELNHMIQICYL